MREAHRVSDGAGLLAAFRAAVANLERHVDEINDLNVFPVPDGDTGSNMLATVRVALEEAESVADRSAGRVAGALSLGALMGARGNSGVITSQICRGIAEGLDGKRRFTGLDLALALTRGAELAYAAVGKPVEGTILTVIREASAAALAAAREQDDIEPVLAAAVVGAERAVAATPTLLPILREAGVVDSGGQGVYRLLEGALLHVHGRADHESIPVWVRTGTRRASGPGDDAEGFRLRDDARARATPRIRPRSRCHPPRAFEAIGQSVVVVGDERAVKVHVHSEQPDDILSHALTMGTLSRISVENLDQQARDVREQRASEFTGASPARPPSRWPRSP